MTADLVWDGAFSLDVAYGYLGSGTAAPQRHNPRLVLNDQGTTVLHDLLQQIKQCSSFTFSVAFVTPGAIALMLQDFIDFQGQGTLITSDYLGFNSPQAFAELLKLEQHGIDVRRHRASRFHPKGYIFENEDVTTAIVGSSNLTKNALATNHEWNLRVSAARGSDLATQLADLVARETANSDKLTTAWISEYARSWIKPTVSRPPSLPATSPLTPQLEPNSMQIEALGRLDDVRAKGETKAMVISATGTGKTILAALDVRAVAPQRLLFIVHREQILDAAINEFHHVLGGTRDDFAKLTGSSKDLKHRYVFATMQTLAQPAVLAQLPTDSFDYVIVDEAHRSGAASYQRILSHFAPKFLLGMTATPERGDGINIFEQFDFNVAYEIRLNHALDANMLSPFHYYGVADILHDDSALEHASPDEALKVLITPERVDHVIDALTTYGQAGVPPRGLIFCSRVSEAQGLSGALNGQTVRGRALRTEALSGADSVSHREAVVAMLERGELDYILTVDVFNEGVDIPTLNQIVMLRQTQSAIVFVQQLGRGLRKAADKDYVVVIDFIANYANNYLIPVALFGDESLNKESLRKNLIAAEESAILPGLSSVRFDRVAQERVLQAISVAKLDSMAMLKSAVKAIAERVGGTPNLYDFHRFESVDPVLLATKQLNHVQLISSALSLEESLTPTEHQMLGLLCHEVFNAKRLHEFLLLQLLLRDGESTLDQVRLILEASGVDAGPVEVRSSIDTLTLENHAEVDHRRYGSGIATRAHSNRVMLSDEFLDSYSGSSEFQAAVDDLLKTGIQMAIDRYGSANPFVPGMQYSRKEVTRLLGFPRKWTSTLYGYKADPTTGYCPVFVTLHKADTVTASTAYEDALIDRESMVWFTKSNRTLASPVENAIANGDYRLPVFVKKDDAEGSESYFLGFGEPVAAEETSMAGGNGSRIPVVKMLLRFEQPVDAGLFDYFHPTLTD